MTEVTITQADRQFIYDLMMPCASNELEKLALEFIREGRGDDAPAVQLAARHRTLTPAQAAGPVLLDIPRDIVEQVAKMGRAEWGATEELTSEGHLAHLETSLRLTREHFNYADIPVKMHGLYLEGTETVLCHTGTSPNSPINAQALTAAWNWLHDQCAAITQGPQA